ncbi:MAG: tRNA dihydrouridine(20/20a) synthase DusA [Gammaproteobacteria bacterium]|nr:MAG: tRNA dihydrouridine(20/20a) synthase DusA [Gammaproteobacteria bacterium]
MLDYTDRHARYLLRLLTRHTTLYTEMVVDQALLRGDPQRFLAFDDSEHPLVLQLGGSDPVSLAQAAQQGAAYGYDQINLNLGCPSARVKAGRFGASLMAEPAHVADLFAAMQQAVDVEVTLKCRIGIDELDSWDHFAGFVQTAAAAGCKTFIVHARKAWLNGLSPKQNRSVPPLNYEFVYRLKRENPQLTIIINGGLDTLSAAATQSEKVDGVMIGRAAYHDPWMLTAADRLLYGDDHPLPTRKEVLEQYIDYMAARIDEGVPLRMMTRHLIGFYQGAPGAKRWRRCLAEEVGRHGDLDMLCQAAAQMELQAA